MFRRNSDQALSRRTKVVSVVSVVGIAVGGALAVFAWNRADETTARETFCWNSLSREDVASVGVKGSGYSSQDSQSPADLTLTQLCQVSTRPDATVPTFALKYGGSSSDWPYGTRSNSSNMGQYVQRFPLGNGLNGWAGHNEAAVWLPDACKRAAKSNGNPVQVTLTLGDNQEDTWGAQETRTRMGRVLMKAATTLAGELGCSTEGFTAPGSTPKPPAERRTPLDHACGLAGFSPLRERASTSDVREIVSGDDYRTWSCVLQQPDGLRLAAFSVTTNPQLVGEYARKVSPNKPGDAQWNGESAVADRSPSVLVGCKDSQALIRVSYPDSKEEAEDHRRAAEHLAPQQDLFEGFARAVTKRMGCELPTHG
ncbi:hypothetical protein [Streptomyces eurocidicus]|uniref:DUF3558 domain-containing protein n=1 Tax=Streptomyces eurocidicus TaxID=66423 RepID=A0A7W8B4G9_STREU|nr:hypothetical protein [Streptomyces eurocidicus]MBB5116619.1 hypothetical protein [Streptomyces eurocidicus]MBF6052379.1 hypothetical protein [Streptomyces eurocidicus]